MGFTYNKLIIHYSIIGRVKRREGVKKAETTEEQKQL